MKIICKKQYGCFSITAGNITQFINKDKLSECLETLIPQQSSIIKRDPTPYERTKAEVYSRGNKWQMENWESTHL